MLELHESCKKIILKSLTLKMAYSKFAETLETLNIQRGLIRKTQVAH
jgi:hypothetical protein